jgi:hypothetical protein
MYQKKCKECNKDFSAGRKKTKFCSKTCSGRYAQKKLIASPSVRKKQAASIKKKWSEDKNYRKKVVDGLKQWNKNNPDKILRGDALSKLVGNATKGRYNESPNNIYDISLRTTRKILKRLKTSCAKCKWNKDICDLHHINGRKIKNPHDHNNLAILCPNCHRLIHSKKISMDGIKNFQEQIGDRWLKYYYG